VPPTGRDTEYQNYSRRVQWHDESGPSLHQNSSRFSLLCGGQMSQAGRIKKILTLGFLLLDMQQLSAQTLPFYDLNYYDSPRCIKEKAASFAKNTNTKADEAVGRSICQVAKMSGESFRKEIAKRWDKIPSEARLKCINDLEQARKSGRIPMVDYGMLESCINDLAKK
jgi:hypothetical protein